MTNRPVAARRPEGYIAGRALTFPQIPSIASPFTAGFAPLTPDSVDLEVQLGRLVLANPVMVASGTFGYAREMAGLVDLARLGGILPKTVTLAPRAGNP